LIGDIRADTTIMHMADRFDEILLEMRKRDDQTDELIRLHGELNRCGEIALRDLLGATAEMRNEIRVSVEMTTQALESSTAHTRAIFALIDRLEGGGPLRPAT
jgi:hypothetical protein